MSEKGRVTFTHFARKQPVLNLRNLHDSLLEVLTALETNPYEHSRHFKLLKPPTAGIYSRRLNRQHRVTYTIDDQTHSVKIISARGHYDD